MVDKLSPVSNMASSRSEENVSLKHFQCLKVSQCWCVLQFCFGHFCLECLVDVIAYLCLAIFCCLADVIAMAIFVVDVKPPGQMLNLCYSVVWMLLPLVLYHVWLSWHDGQTLLPLIFVTDVIVTYWCWSFVTDVIVTYWC